MSKIICDVCGTSYPDTANQCPICGCVRAGDSVTVSGDTMQSAKKPAAYAPVKGGRFSKANVRKRNSGKPIYNAEPPARPQKTQQTVKANEVRTPKTATGSNKAGGHFSANSASRASQSKEISKKTEIGMIIAVVILLIAIAAVVIYIASSFLKAESEKNKTSGSSNTTTNTVAPSDSADSTTTPSDSTDPSVDDTTAPTIQQVACTSVTVLPKQHTLKSAGAVIQLEIQVEPANCTEQYQISTDVEGIVEIDQSGKVTAMSNGAVEVTVTCGEQTDTCRIICEIPGTETTEPPVEQPVYSKADFTFNREDFTISVGSTWTLYNGTIPVELIEWSTGDESVATLVDGVVTPVGSGSTTVKAKYNDWIIECIVRVP